MKNLWITERFDDIAGLVLYRRLQAQGTINGDIIEIFPINFIKGVKL